MESAEERIQERLRNYLKRDGVGIRKAVLKLFLSDGAYTTEDVFTYLAKGIPATADWTTLMRQPLYVPQSRSALDVPSHRLPYRVRTPRWSCR